MNVNEMTRKDFDALHLRSNWSEHTQCNSVVILPLRTKHDSGYRCMDFVAVNEKNEPICRMSGCSDVVHIDGIGGLGYNWLQKFGRCPTTVTPTGWSIDCLPKSGLLRLFPSRKVCIAGEALSSFELFAEEL